MLIYSRVLLKYVRRSLTCRSSTTTENPQKNNIQNNQRNKQTNKKTSHNRHTAENNIAGTINVHLDIVKKRNTHTSENWIECRIKWKQQKPGGKTWKRRRRRSRRSITVQIQFHCKRLKYEARKTDYVVLLIGNCYGLDMCIWCVHVLYIFLPFKKKTERNETKGWLQDSYITITMAYTIQLH